MKYELIYIITPEVEEEARKEWVARFNALIESNGGVIDKVEEWGKRRLAYPINYKTEGYYLQVTFTAGPEVPKEIARNLGNTDEVLRSLITRLETKRSNVKPRILRTPAPPVQAAPTAPDTERAASDSPVSPQA